MYLLLLGSILKGKSFHNMQLNLAGFINDLINLDQQFLVDRRY